MAGPDPQQQWPPRSPAEALMGTPGGRQRYQERLAQRASASPSPSKRARTTAPRRSGDDHDGDMDMDLADDDDEEALQLKLQAIQAKLRLKKLQNAKPLDQTSARADSAPIPSPATNAATATRTDRRPPSMRSDQTARPQAQPEVQVPVSPARKTRPVDSQYSPSRIRLGIDKGLKAKDVSLKRAPGLRKTQQDDSHSLPRPALHRAHSSTHSRSESTTSPPLTSNRPMSFSERLAAARTDESHRQERQERIRQVRSTAFELGQDDQEHFKSHATEIPEQPEQPVEFSRDEIVAGGNIRRSKTAPSLRRPTQEAEHSSSVLSGQTLESQDPFQEPKPKAPRKKKPNPSEVPEHEASAFEPYSSVHLSKRILPHSVLTRNLSGKKTYVIKDLLKHVTAPDFQLPEIEQDIVVFAILASKSDPRAHKQSSNLREKDQPEPSRGKYMVLKLVDLQWELDLFLFNSGFERYWKMTPGTLIAILNPVVMPPPPGKTDTGRFSLVINSGDDTILEVGNARDLGFCKSVKRDGNLCNSWVNRKRTEYCEFHMNNALTQHRQARNDINAFATALGPGSGSLNENKWKKSRRMYDMEKHANDPGLKKRGNYDTYTHSHFFMNRASTAANMLDDEVLPGQMAEKVERSEAARRHIAQREKENKLMKQLGKLGSGAGKEYMQQGQLHRSASAASKPSSTPPSSGDQSGQLPQAPPQLDARSLGLVGSKGSSQPKIHLSPIKRKRPASTLASSSSQAGTSPHSSAGGSLNSASSSVFSSRAGGTASSRGTAASSSSSSSRPALGWGGGLREKLTRMRGGENLRGGTGDSAGGDDPDARGREGAGTPREQATPAAAADTPVGSARERRSETSSPVRKKTRFVTEKGIREAGRESLGGELASAQGGSGSSGDRYRMVELDDDDDDDLLILP